MSDKAYKHFCFVSYSRKDSRAAKWVQDRLEWFRYPLDLVSKDARPPHEKYIRPVYRDRTNLDSDREPYWEKLYQAIDESRFMIVICSPDSARSKAVNQEVVRFLKKSDRQNALGQVVPVILRGHVGSKDEQGCLCPALLEQGGLITNRNLPSMIADDGLSNKEGWEVGFIGLASYLLQVKRESLAGHCQREERKRVRRIQMVAALFGVLMVIAATLGLIAWIQKREAVRQRQRAEKETQLAEASNREALQSLSRFDFLQALRLINENNLNDALAYLSRSISSDPENSAAAGLAAKILTYHSWLVPTLPQAESRQIESMQISDDCKHLVVISTNNAVAIWNVRNRQFKVSALACSNVSSLAFSPDGTRMVTTSGDEAQVWDAESGKESGLPLKCDLPVTFAQFSPDGRRIVSAESSGQLPWATNEVWIRDATTGERIVGPIKHNGPVGFAEFSADEKRILTTWAYLVIIGTNGVMMNSAGNEENINGTSTAGTITIGTNAYNDTVRGAADVWSASTGQALTGPLDINSESPKSANFSSDGENFLTCDTLFGHDSYRVWDVWSGKLLWQPTTQLEGVESAQYTPDGKRLITTSGAEIQIRNSDTGKLIGGTLMSSDAIHLVSISPDGSRVVTVSGDYTVQAWDLDTEKPLMQPMKFNETVVSARFSADGKEILVGTADNGVWLLDGRTGAPLTAPLESDSVIDDARLISGTRLVATMGAQNMIWEMLNRPPVSTRIVEPGSAIGLARFSKDGKKVIAVSTALRNVEVFDSGTGKLLFGFSYGNSAGQNDSVELSPDGTRMFDFFWIPSGPVTTGELWDVQDGKRLIEASMALNGPWAKFSGDSSRIVLTAAPGLQVRNALNGSLLNSIDIDKANTNSLLFFSSEANSEAVSSDRKRVIISCGPLNDICNLENGADIANFFLPEGIAYTVAFSPNGKDIGVIGDNVAYVINGDNGRTLAGPLAHYRTVNSLDFSPDGRFIATASSDKMARIWDVKTGQLLTDPLKLGTSVQSVHFSGDGRHIVTIAGSALQLWDAEIGQPITDSLDAGAYLQSAQFSPDGNRVLTVSSDGEARIWDFNLARTRVPDWLFQLIEAVSGRVLNKQGVLQATTLDRATVIAQIRQRLEGDPSDDEWVAWGRWFLGDLSTRTISPYSQVTVPEYVDECIKANSIDEASKFAFGSPELEARISNAAKASAPGPPTIVHGVQFGN